MPWVDKVVALTKSFASLFPNAVALVAAEIEQFADQFNSKLVSQLIAGISRVLREFFLLFLR